MKHKKGWIAYPNSQGTFHYFPENGHSLCGELITDVSYFSDDAIKAIPIPRTSACSWCLLRIQDADMGRSGYAL